MEQSRIIFHATKGLSRKLVTLRLRAVCGEETHELGEITFPLQYWYILRLGLRLSEANTLYPLAIEEEESP